MLKFLIILLIIIVVIVGGLSLVITSIKKSFLKNFMGADTNYTKNNGNQSKENQEVLYDNGKTVVLKGEAREKEE